MSQILALLIGQLGVTILRRFFAVYGSMDRSGALGHERQMDACLSEPSSGGLELRATLAPRGPGGMTQVPSAGKSQYLSFGDKPPRDSRPQHG